MFKFLLKTLIGILTGSILAIGLIQNGADKVFAIMVALIITFAFINIALDTPKLTVYTANFKPETPKRKRKPLTPEQRKRKNDNARANYAKKKSVTNK